MDALGQSATFSNAVPPFGEDTDNRRRASHVSRACDQCRQRKCKCDGKPAVCFACRVSNLVCTWKGTDKRRGLSEQVDVLRTRVEGLEKLFETLVESLNANGAGAGGAQFPEHPSSSIKTPDMACQSPLTPVSSAPLSPVAGSSASLGPSTGAFASPGGDSNFLTVPSDHRHMRGGTVSSAASGFIPWGSGMTSPNASRPLSPYSATSGHPTANYGMVGELPQNVGYVLEQLADTEVSPVLVFYANGGEAAEEHPIPDSPMDDHLWHERLFGHT